MVPTSRKTGEPWGTPAVVVTFSPAMDEKQQFRWGIALVWVPLLVLLVTLSVAFRGISQEKATGLAAVAAGGLVEAAATFGLVTFPACVIGGIVLLAKSMVRGQPGRSALSAVSIGCGGLMVMLMALAVWFLYFGLRRAS